jgi:preprotein translocase subunit SecE
MAKVMTATTGGSGAQQGLVQSIKTLPQRTKSFYTEVRTEMKKVTSPSRKEVQSTTIVVIITVFAFGAYFGIIDWLIGRGVGGIITHFTHR